MNAVEKLLKFDAGKIKAPEEVITMYLAKLGTTIDFPCECIRPEKYSELQESMYEVKHGDIKSLTMHKSKVMTIVEGCPKIFKAKEIMEHFGCVTPPDLVNKLMLSGEIDDLKGKIDKLNGYDEDKSEKEREEIKN
jgi:hypothetical protein